MNGSPHLGRTVVNTQARQIDPEFAPPASAITVSVRFFDPAGYIAVALCCLSRVALAEPVEEPLRLEYRASATCDDEQQFFAALRARAPRARLARSNEPARVFSVEIEQGAHHTRARLIIREPNGQRTVRDLETKDCREAVDALALVAALAVDPQAVAESASRANVGAEPASKPAARSEAVVPPVVPAPSKSSEDVEEMAAADLRVSTPRSWVWGISVAGAGRGGVAPGFLGGGRLGAVLERNRGGWWAPAMRLSAEFATRNGFAVEGGVATFAYAAGSLEVCPLRIPAAGPFVARPCLMADLGIVHATGSEVLNARSANPLWLAVGGMARFEWLLTARIGIELDVGCTFPVWRDRFRFDPRLVYEVAKISTIAALGVTMHFP